MIRAYPHAVSVAPDEAALIHVSCDAAHFRMRLYRFEQDFVPVWVSDALAGQTAPEGTPDSDWQWPTYSLPADRGWPSGVYIAQICAEGILAPPIDFNQPTALFIVRGKGQSPLLYKIPSATYHAYNCTGGGCLYDRPRRSAYPPGSKVSLRRPGGGIGGDTWGVAD